MNLALRSFSLAFLAWHGGRLFPGLADPWFMAAAAVVGLVGGSQLRWWKGVLALPTGALVFLTVQTVLTQVPPWLTGSEASTLDSLPLWAERQLWFSLVPFALGWFEGWAFTGRPRSRGWERLIHAAAVVCVFWSQGPYHITLYPHPLAFALAIGLFLVSELALLAGQPPRSWAKGMTILVVVAAIGLLWGLLGRYEDQSTASGGGLMKPDLFQFDFAPLVRLEDQITLGDNLVLLYREEGTPQTRYLRRMVLDDYNPTRGFSVAGGKPPVVGRRPQTFAVPAGSQERLPIRQEYYLVNLDPSSLLALNAPVALTPYAQWNRSSFVNAYRVDSLVAGLDFWLFNEEPSDGLSPEERAQNTAGGDDAEIRALAESMTRGAATRYEKATAILIALKENYFYSLKPGNPGSRGALKHFLFEGKKGYCSYFAFSMALLLRSLDIPARIAVGFATNPADSVLGFTPVRAFQAHAWVEVPFGPYGWLEFDPTSETPAPGEPFQYPKATDSQSLSKLIAEILQAQPQPLTDSPPAPVAPGQPSWERVWTTSVALAPWGLLVVLLGLNEGWRHRWRWARWRAFDERQRVALLWNELVYRATRAGVGPRQGETPQAWALRASEGGTELEPLAADISLARYAPGLPLGWESRVARQTRPLGRRFDRLRPRLHRAMATLFPWWQR